MLVSHICGARTMLTRLCSRSNQNRNCHISVRETDNVNMMSDGGEEKTIRQLTT